MRAAELRAARRPGRRSAARACAATPRSSNSPPCARRSSASAAVSGRIAVPALPRKSVACVRREPAAEAGDVRRASPSRVDAAAERAQRRRASPACRRSRAGRDVGRAARRSPASSSTRFEMLFEPGRRTVPAARVERRQVEEAESTYTVGSVSARTSACVLRPSARSSASRRAPRLALRISVLERLGVAGLASTCSIASSVWRKRCDCFRISSRLAIRMSRQISGSLAAMRVKSRKPGPASDRKSRPAGWLRDRVEVGEGQQVRQVADGGEGGVVVLRRHAQHLRADRGPDVGGLLHQLGRGLRQRRQDHLAARRTASASACCDARHFLAGDRVRRHERRRCGPSARAARRRPRRAWSSRRP